MLRNKAGPREVDMQLRSQGKATGPLLIALLIAVILFLVTLFVDF
jgi:hypothetical protein